MLVFTLEYGLRLISSPYLYGDRFEVGLLFRYAMSPMAMIDLAAILPFYLPFVFHCDLRLVRIVRLFRLLRLLKFKRYSQSLELMVGVIQSKKVDLIVTFVLISVMLLICGAVMYTLENESQPEIFPNIVEAAYWCLKTMVFLGYETAPASGLGKLIGILVTLLGLGWIALPISIISSGFMEAMQSQQAGGESPSTSGSAVSSSAS